MATIEDVKIAWNKNAVGWAESIKKDPLRTLFNEPCFLEFLGDMSDKSVLDAACGEGSLTKKIVARQITGIDLSSSQIELAKQQGIPGAEFHIGSVGNMDMFAAGTFDAVTSFMALIDIADLQPAMAEMARVLKPGGQLHIAIRHPCFLAPKFGIVQVPRTQEPRLVLGEYFSRDAHDAGYIIAPGVTIPRFPRTLSDYLNGIVGVGLELVRVQEPTPSVEAAEQAPQLQFWREHAAMYLYLTAEKPAGANGKA